MNRLDGWHNDKGGFQATQNIDDHVAYAKAMRESVHNANSTFREFAVIPDVVAIDIHLQYKIDVHDEAQMREPVIQNRLKKIIKTYYPYLLSGGISNRFSLGGSFDGN